MPGHEFFTALTVQEALSGFRPGRRTAVEVVALDDALRRVPSEDVVAPAALPGFARSTVDGFAVRAADTYGVSDGLPGYLDVVGAVRMGRVPDTEVRPGTAVAIPTGGALPPGADAVVMVEYTQVVVPGTIEVVRPTAPGDGMVRADEDVVAGARLAPAGRPLRAQDLGLLAAAGIRQVRVRARPTVAILSTGDEVVPAGTGVLLPGQVRDATAIALAALVTGGGGTPEPRGIVPDDAAALDRALRAALSTCDLAVVSAGSSVGARDETAGVIAGLGPPGIFCHGLAIRPGKPTVLAECQGVPVIGLPGHPLSALVVFRLVGLPVQRLVGGCVTPPTEPGTRARLGHEVPSVAGRLDVVQVRLCHGVAEPVFGHSALLSVLASADGYVVVPEAATGLPAGSEVDVKLYD
jgi:molybdopterin molybdotransferase